MKKTRTQKITENKITKSLAKSGYSNIEILYYTKAAGYGYYKVTFKDSIGNLHFDVIVSTAI